MNAYILNVRFMSLVVLLTCHSSAVSQYQIYLDSRGRYHFQWTVDYPKQLINVKLTAKVTADRWFAFGFSDYGEVTSADLVAVWTSEGDKHHFVDSYTDGDGVLLPDPQQDYNLTFVSEGPGHVVLQFHRAFDTCDVNDYILDNGTTHVIFVESDALFGLPFGSDVTRLHHGVQRTQLLKPDLGRVNVPVDTWTFDVRMPEITVPGEETTYWWETVVLPDIKTPHHIIQYEGIIAEGNEDLVHHMEVFHCEVNKRHRLPVYSGPGMSEGQPEGLEVCRRVIGAWAMGAQAMVYPEEAGVPVGGQNYSRVALLEVHYNNPRKMAGRVDTSGIRFYVTSHLRNYDAGIMELGLEYTNKMAIPPRQKRFQLRGYCTNECTRVALPPGGIHVFASQLHTHLTGRRVYTKHARHGHELAELNRDNHYSPHFQEIRRLAHPVLVLPSDDLITTCEYDTSGRPLATVGGFSISDEMCLNYIHYYPKCDLEVCKSSIQTHELNTFMFLLNRLEGANVYQGAGYRANYKNIDWSPANVHLLKTLYDTSLLSMQCNKLEGANVYQGAGYRANYKNIDWSPANVHLLKTLYDTSLLSMQCNKSDGSRFPGDWEHIRTSQITEPFIGQHPDALC